MSVKIDTQARIGAVRFQNQTGSPAAPAAGYSLLYMTTNGLYMETSGGAVIGPFVTGTAAAPAGGRTLIAESTPTGTTATFSAIPGTYKKLVIEFAIRSTQAAATVSGVVEFNGDTTTTNYRFQEFRINNFGNAGTAGNTNTLLVNQVAAASSTAGEFTQGHIEIIQYANTGFQHMAGAWSWRKQDSSEFIDLAEDALWWNNTAAITQIDVKLSAGNFVAGSVLRLYGEN